MVLENSIAVGISKQSEHLKWTSPVSDPSKNEDMIATYLQVLTLLTNTDPAKFQKIFDFGQ